MYDVTIIGAGVVGCSIARELSRYKLKVCVLEKESDVAMGTSKANSAIVHAGFDAKPGTLKALLNVKGNSMFDTLSRELDFHFRRNGSLVAAFEEKETGILEQLKFRGVRNGVAGLEILTGDRIFALEPGLNRQIKAALYAPTGGITCPYEMTWALAENAVFNGVDILLEQKVTGISKNQTEGFVIHTKKRAVESRFLVNAAGVFADDISKMAGAERFDVIPRKGEYCLLDKPHGGMIKSTLFSAPGPLGKGVLVTPTVDGNILIGPNASNVRDKIDVSTTDEGLEQVVSGGLKLVPGLPVRSVITSFAGLRAVSGNDFIIEASQKLKGFINVAGICSPGLSAALAIGIYVKDILHENGLKLKENIGFTPYRKAIARFREMNNVQRSRLIKENSLFGRIICRCETVTEGEIVEAINRPCGAKNLDAVKRRVRAGMGRCQGGFCSPRIVEILAREMEVEMTNITKCGEHSFILEGRSRKEE